MLIGVRDNERASEAYAIRARNAHILAFAISGFLAGVAGALFVLQQQLLISQVYTPDVSLRIFSMVVVGGLGSISGAVLGAVFVYGVQYFLPSQWAFLATGAGLLLVLLLVPGGLGADVRRRPRRPAAALRRAASTSASRASSPTRSWSRDIERGSRSPRRWTRRRRAR